jgi:hypothetical protein
LFLDPILAFQFIKEVLLGIHSFHIQTKTLVGFEHGFKLVLTEQTHYPQKCSRGSVPIALASNMAATLLSTPPDKAENHAIISQL